jgi:hypothetical protein
MRVLQSSGRGPVRKNARAMAPNASAGDQRIWMHRAIALVGSWPLVAGCGLLSNPSPDSDSVVVAAHASFEYHWTDDTCFRSGPACVEDYEGVAVEYAESMDPEIAEVRFEGDRVSIVTHAPGQTVVELEGEHGYRRELVVTVATVAELSFVETRLRDGHMLVLPGMRTVHRYVPVDESGRPLEGLLELDLVGTGGAQAEPIDGTSLLVLTAPAERGAFEITDATLGSIVTGEVVSEADIDGVLQVYSLVAPTIAGHMLAAGEVEIVGEPVDPGSACRLEAESWGVPPPVAASYDPHDSGDEDATWSLSVQPEDTGAPCEMRVTLPGADAGRGVSAVISL